MNTVLGVPFTSRLMQNLRETHGYTYGAWSRFDMRREAGPFVAQAEVVAGKTDSALVEFVTELRAIRDTVPRQELQKAKRYLQLQLPSLFEATGDIAYQLTSLAVYGLPLDFYNSYVQRIDEVTQADVQRVARKYIDPERLSIVIVGDRKQIESGIRKLGLGEILLRDIHGKPVQ
jgi:predicted Zn-dependent peptidase